MMFIVYTTLVLLNAHLAFSHEQWVDPHDMIVKDSNIFSTSDTGYDRSSQAHDCPVPINFSMSHYKRLINLLLGAVAIDRSDTASFRGHLHISIPVDKYDFLRDFANTADTTEDAAVLRQIDQVLSSILTKPSHAQFADFLVSWTDHIYFTFYNRTTGILAACVFVLFISYKLLRANLTIWSVVKYLIFLGWVTDFAFTWVNLLQEAEINKMADSMKYQSLPPHCDPNKMSVWQYLVYSVSSTDECRNYHQMIYKDHFWSIAPVTVLSYQLGVVIYTPASHIGQALGKFSSGLLDTLPWGVNIILLPVLLIFFAVLLCIVFSFLTQTSFGFNFLHVLQLQFGNDERRAMGDVLTGRNLTALLNMADRSMIEDVRQTNSAENSVTLQDSACSNSNKPNEGLMIKEGIPSGNDKEDVVVEKLELKAGSSGDNVHETELIVDAGRSSNKVKDVISNEPPHEGSGDGVT